MTDFVKDTCEVSIIDGQTKEVCRGTADST